MGSLQVLVIDDEPAIRQVLASYLGRSGYVTEHVGDGQSALSRLAKGDVDIAICDIRMPDMTGIEVVKQAREAGIETTFLMMTAYASVSTAIDAMRAGAHDYMIKPLRNEDVLLRLEQLGKFISLRDENRALRRVLMKDNRCVLRSAAMQHIERLIGKVAPTNSTVMLTGESGTGKGVLARAIHSGSPRAASPFIPVNCGAIPENLLESEFFGHTKGAFTGADRAKRGLFLEADGGTMFLDEIGELPLALQVKLLHAIESGEIRPVGAERTRKVDVRIIAATNRDIADMVQKGEFREDLYFRLNVFSIRIPPLRERKEDVRSLLEFFQNRNAAKMGLPEAYALDPEATEALLEYEWPGNVRELENIMERAHILAENAVIGVEDLPSQLVGRRGLKAAPEQQTEGSGTLRNQVRRFEVDAILRAVRECGGDRREAARNLGIGLSTLYRKLEGDADD